MVTCSCWVFGLVLSSIVGTVPPFMLLASDRSRPRFLFLVDCEGPQLRVVARVSVWLVLQTPHAAAGCVVRCGLIVLSSETRTFVVTLLASTCVIVYRSTVDLACFWAPGQCMAGCFRDI